MDISMKGPRGILARVCERKEGGGGGGGRFLCFIVKTFALRWQRSMRLHCTRGSPFAGRGLRERLRRSWQEGEEIQCQRRTRGHQKIY